MRRNSTVCYRENGFIVATPDDILARVSGYERMTVDPSVSTDFFTRGGKPIPLHGTTYFVTDVWQNCFVDFNAALCINDLRQLRLDGFNILRSGNWVNRLDFYGPDGRITEYCRRALTFFLPPSRTSPSSSPSVTSRLTTGTPRSARFTTRKISGK